MIYGTVIGVWGAVFVAGFAALWGVSITIGTVALVLAAGLVPSAIVLKMGGGASPQTVAELLHAVDRD
jgi:hypothetical protein